jgi:hypothetical protein
VDDLRGAPMSVGSLEEIIDDKCVTPNPHTQDHARVNSRPITPTCIVAVPRSAPALSNPCAFRKFRDLETG